MEIARTLHVKHKIPVNEMAVLTPYSAQKDTIKKVVNDEPKPLNTLLVVSISESQGIHVWSFGFLASLTNLSPHIHRK